MTDLDCGLSLVALHAETLPALAVQKPPCEHVPAVSMAAGVAAELAVADVALYIPPALLQLDLSAVCALDTACDLEPHASDA